MPLDIYEPRYFTPHTDSALNSAFMYLPLKQRHDTGDAPNRDISLPAGVHTIRLEWKNPTKPVQVMHRPSGGSSSQVAQVEAGKSLVLTVTCRTDGDVIWFRLPGVATPDDDKYTLAVSIIPGPAYDNTAT